MPAGLFISGETEMHENTCGGCGWWGGNRNLMGGPCELHGGIRYPGQSCECFERKTDWIDQLVIVWLWILIGLCGMGTAYFFWFLFYRAGFFG